MDDIELKFRFVVGTRSLCFANKLPTSAVLRSEEHFDQSIPNTKTKKYLIAVKGQILEGREEYEGSLEFVFPDDALERIDKALIVLERYVNSRTRISMQEEEATIDVFDWLRIGWMDVNAEYFGYLSFQKDGASLIAKTSDLRGIAEFAHSLHHLVGR